MRFLRVSGALLLVAAAVATGLWGYAFVNVNESAWTRALIWLDADVQDWRKFPARRIPRGPVAYRYEHGPGYPDGLPRDAVAGHADLARLLADNQTTAFIAIQGGKLIYERYFNGSSHDAVQTSFSVAKSFNSALLGRAIADGLLALDAPVTRYLPELRQRDPGFDRITLRHLVSMSSGLHYVENGTPWGDDALTYYHPRLRRLALETTRIVEPPGTRFLYNNYNPLLLGMVLERVTGQHVAAYLADKVWQPLGAEADASWSLDSTEDGFEKMESGINARAIDFAKLGSLYLNRGKWRGVQVLPAEWVDESTRYGDATDPALQYQYGWWTFRDARLGDYYAAMGNKGQYVFVFPRQDLVIVRNGIDRGALAWHKVIPEIARRVAAAP